MMDLSSENRIHCLYCGELMLNEQMLREHLKSCLSSNGSCNELSRQNPPSFDLKKKFCNEVGKKSRKKKRGCKTKKNLEQMKNANPPTNKQKKDCIGNPDFGMLWNCQPCRQGHEDVDCALCSKKKGYFIQTTDVSFDFFLLIYSFFYFFFFC
ncbi:hypothetical protein RFI_16956 [Reticulomyxa filosa]|uniref:UBZ4-type domain-containing protein n=1 Tax=Reticulomyxa filosa TaxID=46433 RepID=X6N3D2_RETFI|nr:hypothetical protein RFI_16956 [Reticulomyxa filosa]|eukprot:ETO20264.1 hypothetical protein RFI_16956 [Reticulomyxa filosa]